MLGKKIVIKIKRWYYLRMGSLCGNITRRCKKVDNQFYWVGKEADYFAKYHDTYYHIPERES